MNHLQHYWDTLLLNLKSLRSFIKDKNKNRLPKCVPADSESRIPLNTLGFLEELEMLAGCEIDEFAFYEDYNDAFENNGDSQKVIFTRREQQAMILEHLYRGQQYAKYRKENG